LALVCLPFRKNTSALFWSIISGFFGLGFGTLCTLPYLITGGPAAAFSYWVSGLGFDITHCIGNVVLCLVLFKPLYSLLEKAVSRT
jgi:energy-coupling factor transport system substrate-specific component